MMQITQPGEPSPGPVKSGPLTKGGDAETGFFCIGRGATMEDLSGFLSQKFDRPVFDKTGLTAKYDFELHYRGTYTRDRDINASATPPLDEAIQWQLGLRVKPSPKGTELYVIVDHVDKPALD
jgi:uncharacterized protein (TIGR03435 family)